ncbi:hypothetical protein HanXRQr2_Chr05g0211971 [Helianthus annuus]|uniref:Uncharacterized protein n=1 Tax=Helianthus annuus TaxID=4232 RepID=A0A9K3NM29_HELAN|nr:hypothetical protein HanXRQr2_Chr05g0211971 [Helianthus annuus]
MIVQTKYNAPITCMCLFGTMKHRKARLSLKLLGISSSQNRKDLLELLPSKMEPAI